MDLNAFSVCVSVKIFRRKEKERKRKKVWHAMIPMDTAPYWYGTRGALPIVLVRTGSRALLLVLGCEGK